MKSSLLTILIFVVLTTGLVAQQSESLAMVDEDTIEVEAAPLADRLMPALKTGELLTFLYEQLEYPAIAIENGAEGTVVIALNVGADGLVKTKSIIRSIPLLDTAALAAVDQLPRLLPAVEDGVAVERMLYIPIRFRLQ